MSLGPVDKPADGERSIDVMLAAAADRALGETPDHGGFGAADPDGFTSDPHTIQFELAAASVELAWMKRAGDFKPLPAPARASLLLAAETWLAQSTPPARGTSAREPLPPRPLDFRREPASDRAGSWSGRTVVPWFLAAASLVFAALMSFRGPNNSTPLTRPPEELRAQFLKTVSDKVTPWTDWDNPEIAGVQGDVVWSDVTQSGFMRLAGLLPTESQDLQYQLWIIDGTRGMEQRISGGIFDCPRGCRELIVPIDPKLKVNKAAAFAITIERRGGTWVSDMKRRVVIAKL